MVSGIASGYGRGAKTLNFDFTGCVVVCAGDSITVNQGNYQAMKDALGCTVVYNRGSNGRRLMVYGGYGPTVRLAHADVYTTFETPVNVVLTEIGVNDSSFWNDGGATDANVIGTIASNTYGDWYGALDVYIIAMRLRYPGARLIFKAPAYANDTVNGCLAVNIIKLVDAMLLKCAAMGVDCFDQFRLGGINAGNASTMLDANVIHPTGPGQALLNAAFFQWCKTLPN